MKKKVLFMMAFFATGVLNAQSVSNGEFNGNTGYVSAAGVASPWQKGCAYNTSSNSSSNNPEIILDGSNNVLELEGDYNAYQGAPSFDLESAEQWVGALPSGEYTITFNARNRLLTSGNPGIRLSVNLKNYSGCSWLTSNSNPQQINKVISISPNYIFNTYSVTFCIPSNLHNELSYLELGAIHQDETNVSCDGVIDIDNVTLTNTSEPYDLAFDYQIDCLTGQLQIKPNSPFNPNLHYVFIVMENNPNDPNNQNDTGDVQHSANWWNTPPNSQGWYTVPTALEKNKNYYIKRGIWGDCMSWKEARKFNIELQPDQFNSSFSHSVFCNDDNNSILSVTGADQQGKNPHHMFTLYEYFPGTNTPDQSIETIGYWNQSNTNNYQYQQGAFTFSHVLDPLKYYYVKRGVWDACTPWTESRTYGIQGIACASKPRTFLSKSREVVSDEITLFPNPTKDILSIETSVDYDEFQIFSINGKLVGTYASSEIPVANLESGYYILKLIKDGNILNTERFVKQ